MPAGVLTAVEPLISGPLLGCSPRVPREVAAALEQLSPRHCVPWQCAQLGTPAQCSFPFALVVPVGFLLHGLGLP